MNAEIFSRPAARRRNALATRGFTLIELMITVVVVAILAAIALPSYQSFIKRGSREAAQAELIEMSGTQEKIYLNSNAYTASVTGAYTGNSTGGLGVTNGLSRDSKYSYGATVNGPSYTITATPVTGQSQAGDGNLVITSDGTRTWGTKSW